MMCSVAGRTFTTNVLKPATSSYVLQEEADVVDIVGQSPLRCIQTSEGTDGTGMSWSFLSRASHWSFRYR
jgi:hypothetical protein